MIGDLSKAFFYYTGLKYSIFVEINTKWYNKLCPNRIIYKNDKDMNFKIKK